MTEDKGKGYIILKEILRPLFLLSPAVYSFIILYYGERLGLYDYDGITSSGTCWAVVAFTLSVVTAVWTGINANKALKTKRQTNKTLESIKKIRSSNLRKIVEHLDKNFQSKSFMEIVTEPEKQIEVILSEVDRAVKDHFGKNDIRTVAYLAYKPISSDKWLLITEEDEFEVRDPNIDAKDIRTTMYSVLSKGGDLFAFHNFKSKVVKDSEDDPSLKDTNVKRYRKIKQEFSDDLKHLPGSILCRYFSVISKEKEKDDNRIPKITYIQAVLTIHTIYEPFIGKTKRFKEEQIKDALGTHVLDHYLEMLKFELALLLMKQ